ILQTLCLLPLKLGERYIQPLWGFQRRERRSRTEDKLSDLSPKSRSSFVKTNWNLLVSATVFSPDWDPQVRTCDTVNVQKFGFVLTLPPIPWCF
ncbi:uncharacterized, partial [Tachysurus ichikawai]